MTPVSADFKLNVPRRSDIYATFATAKVKKVMFSFEYQSSHTMLICILSAKCLLTETNDIKHTTNLDGELQDLIILIRKKEKICYTYTFIYI